MKSLPVAAGLVAGVLLASLIAGGAVGTAEATPQDPAVQMQIDQALNNFRSQLQVRLNLMQTQVDTMEREVRTMRFQLDTGTANGRASATPIPSDPIPGAVTWGRIVSQSNESERFVLTASTGQVFARLEMTTDGAALILYDVTGQISTALVATPTGAELRMIDADGILQTVLPRQ